MKLSTIFLRAARKVAEGEDEATPLHHTCCDALVLVAHGTDYLEAYHQFCDWIGFAHTGLTYWYGRNYVYQRMSQEHIEEKIPEVLANRQARIYALLLMWRIAKADERRKKYESQKAR